FDDVWLVKPREDVLAIPYLAIDKRQMVNRIKRRAVGVTLKGADRTIDREGRYPLDQLFAGLPMRNQVRDRHVLQVILLGESYDLLAFHHRTIVVHQFAEHADQRQTRQPAEINCVL